MSEAKKLYTAKLANGHTEDWTEAEMQAVKAAFGDRFAEYEVTPLQPEKPADVPSAPSKAKAKDADSAA